MSVRERLLGTCNQQGMSKVKFVKLLKEITHSDTHTVKNWIQKDDAEINDVQLQQIARHFSKFTGKGIGWWRYGDDAYSSNEKRLLHWAEPYIERERQINNVLERATRYCAWHMQTVDFTVDWAENSEEVFGFMPDKNMMSLMGRLDHQHRADTSMALLRCVCLEMDFFSIVFSMNTQSGFKRFHFYGDAVIERDESGREYVNEIRGGVADISHMQISTRELAMCDNRLRSALHANSGIICIVDTDGTVGLLQGRLLDESGISIADYLRRTVFDLRGRGTNDNLARALSGEIFTTQVSFGNYLIETEFSPIYKANGVGIEGMMVAAWDVTAANKKTSAILDELRVSG